MMTSSRGLAARSSTDQNNPQLPSVYLFIIRSTLGLLLHYLFDPVINVCRLVRSFAHSCVRPLIRSTIRSFARWFVHSLARAFARSLVRLFAHSLARSLGHSLVRSIVCLLKRSLDRFLGHILGQFPSIFCNSNIPKNPKKFLG